MHKIHIATEQPYDVLIGESLLLQAGTLLRQFFSPCRLGLVTDSNVAPLYLDMLRASLAEAGFHCSVFVFPAGEGSKNLNTYGQLLSFFAQEHLTRSDMILALGGGVCGDMAGFAAASYLRGISWIQMPTTLLAAVDAAVGGKTAVDLPEGKNLVGAFHQPSLVLCDCACLQSLESMQVQDGLAEMLKHGLIADKALFQRLSKKMSLADADLAELISRNVEIKSAFVLSDEQDHGLRQILNFGHTIGHGIEKCSAYKISHGHAVAMGMLVEARAAYRMALSPVPADIIGAALSVQDLPISCPFTEEEIWNAALGDKKRSGDQINLVCLREIGDAQLRTLNLSDFRRFVALALEASYG